MFDDLKQNQNQNSSKELPGKEKEQPQHGLADAFEHRLEQLKNIGYQKAKRKKIFLVLLAIFSIFMIGSVSLLVYMTWPDAKTFTIKFYNANFKKDAGVMCAADAKECPDGSYVSRIAPSCEFPDCPEVIEEDCVKEGAYIDLPTEDSFECCGDLVKIPVTAPMDENCEPIIPEGSTGPEPGWTCLACGDGECNSEYENKCNCPEDCKEDIDTSAWQTYQNEEYGFEFKYPNNLQCPSKINDPNANIGCLSKTVEYKIVENSEGPITPFNMSILKERVVDDSRDEIENIKKLYEYQNYKEENLQIGNTNSIKISGVIGAESYVTDYYNIRVYIPKNSFTIMFDYYNVDTETINENTFNLIISTLKFINNDTILKQADSDTPAAGICGIAGESLGIANIDINQDTSSPRCIKIFATEKIKFTNNTDKEINIDFAGYNLIIEPGDSEMIDKAVGEFLELGIHIIPNVAEVWVVPSTDSPIPEIDTDNDGLSDEKEEMYNTDPENPDTDDDGYLDGEEVKNGYNPNGEGELTTNN